MPKSAMKISCSIFHFFGINLTVSRIKFDAKFCRDIVYHPYGHPYLYVNIHIRQLDDNNIVKEFSKWAQ